MNEEEVAVYYQLLPQEVKDYAREQTYDMEYECFHCKKRTDVANGFTIPRIRTSNGDIYYAGVCIPCFNKSYSLYSARVEYVDY